MRTLVQLYVLIVLWTNHWRDIVTTACLNRGSTARTPFENIKFGTSTPIDRLFAVKDEVEELTRKLPVNTTKIRDFTLMLQLLDETSRKGTKGAEQDPDRIFSEDRVRCNGCKFGVKLVFEYIRKGGSKMALVKFAETMCFLFVYRSNNVCKGIIRREIDPLQYIVRHSSVSSSQFCALILSALYDGSCGIYRGPRWSLSLPPPKRGLFNRRRASRSIRKAPSQSSHNSNHIVSRTESERNASFDISRSFQVAAPDNFIMRRPISEINLSKQTISVVGSQNLGFQFINNFVPAFNNGNPYLKVLHLTDIHFDPAYREGTSAVCEAPICCMKESGVPFSPGLAAGKWGDYRNCDSPRALIENMLNYIRVHHKDIDYIIVTGDNVPHDIWRISRRHNLFISREVSNMIHFYFPNTPVYSAVGNHEGFPRDSFPPPEVPSVWKKFGNQWLYDNLVKQWQSFLPNNPIPNSARYAGCYSMLISPGFRMISINTSYCYKWNWWILLKSTDPGRVLRWLVNELLMAEANGEYVHIIGHVAPHYNECFEQWRHQYTRLLTRFSHVIRGQFFGHCHRDDIRLQYDVRDPRRAIGVQYLTPNNGPFTNLNPSFRLFYIDGDHKDSTRGVIDYETYFTNLTAANINGEPQWQLLYRAKRDLDLKSMEPREWDQMLKRVATDNNFFNKYYKYHVQASDVLLRQGCNFECKKKILCSAVDSDYFLPKKCVS